MVSTRGVRYKFSEGERVLCYEPDPTKAKVLYDSKVLEVIESKDKRGRRTVEYLIHFQGWNSSWDRCVSEDFVLKDTEENRQLQRDLAEKSQLQLGAYLYRRERKKGGSAGGQGPAKRAKLGFSDDGSSSSTQPDEGETAGDTDSSMCSGSSSQAATPPHNMHIGRAQINLPPALRDRLTFDYHLIVKRGRLPQVPASPSAADILESFVKWFARSGAWRPTRVRATQDPPHRPDLLDVCCRLNLVREVADGLRVYFDFILEGHLLYKQEHHQYYQVCGQYHDKHEEQLSPESDENKKSEGSIAEIEVDMKSPKIPEYAHLPPDPSDLEKESQLNETPAEEHNDKDEYIDNAANDKDVNDKDKNEAVQQNDNVVLEKDKRVIVEEKPVLEKDKTLHDKDKTVHDKDKTVPDKDVTDKSKAVHNKDKIVHDKDKIVHDKDKMVQDTDKIVHAKDKMIHDKDKMVHDKDKMVPDKDKMVHDKDKMVHVKDKMGHDKDKMVHGKEKLVHDKDKMVHDKDKILHGKEKIVHEKDKMVHDKDKMLHDKDKMLHDKDKMVHDKEKSANDKDKVVPDKVVHDKEQTIHDTDKPANDKINDRTEDMISSGPNSGKAGESRCATSRESRCATRSGNLARRLRSHKSAVSQPDTEEPGPSTSTGEPPRTHETLSSSVCSSESSISSGWCRRAPPSTPAPHHTRTPLSLLMDKVAKWQIIPREGTEYLPCRVYGAIHLARLFVKLPDFLNAMQMPDQKLKLILKHIDMFVQYLEEHNEWFGEMYYYVPESNHRAR